MLARWYSSLTMIWRCVTRWNFFSDQWAKRWKSLPRHRISCRKNCPTFPPVWVVDIRLPGLSGLDFQAELARANIRIPIVFMTGHGDIPMTVKAMKAGAIEFLAKPFRDQDMLDAIGIGLERDRIRREHDKTISDVRSKFSALTPREQEVMGLVTAGLMNKQISGEMRLAEITVKVHRGSVMRKMGAKSLADLVRMADMLKVAQRPN
jgi:FixJ family two-component response regulator